MVLALRNEHPFKLVITQRDLVGVRWRHTLMWVEE